MLCKTSIVSLAIVMVTVPLCGCDALLYGAGPHPRWPRYTIGFANDTDQFLSNVRAEWPLGDRPYRCSAGYLSVGAEKMNNEEVDPIPARVIVYWTTPDKVEHHAPLEVAPRIKDIAWFSGTVWFKFSDNGVEILTTNHDEPFLKIRHRP